MYQQNVSTNVVSTVSASVTCTVLINFHKKKVRYRMECYTLHTVLLVEKCWFRHTVWLQRK